MTPVGSSNSPSTSSAATAASTVSSGQVNEGPIGPNGIQVVGVRQIFSNGVIMTNSSGQNTMGFLDSRLTPNVAMTNSNGSLQIDPKTGLVKNRVRTLADFFMGKAQTTRATEDKAVAKPATPKPPKPTNPPAPPPKPIPAAQSKTPPLDVGDRPLSLADRLLEQTATSDFKSRVYAKSFKTEIVESGNVRRLAAKFDRLNAAPPDKTDDKKGDKSSDKKDDHNKPGPSGGAGASGAAGRSGSRIKFTK